MALNWKCWEHEKNTALMELYLELYEKADEWCVNNLTGNDLEYFYQTTD